MQKKKQTNTILDSNQYTEYSASHLGRRGFLCFAGGFARGVLIFLLLTEARSANKIRATQKSHFEPWLELTLFALKV